MLEIQRQYLIPMLTLCSKCRARHFNPEFRQRLNLVRSYYGATSRKNSEQFRAENLVEGNCLNLEDWCLLQRRILKGYQSFRRSNLTSGPNYRKKSIVPVLQDEALADKIAKKILQKRLYKKGAIIEVNAGYGILTKALLQNIRHPTQYFAIEGTADCLKSLKALSEEVKKDSLVAKSSDKREDNSWVTRLFKEMVDIFIVSQGRRGVYTAVKQVLTKNLLSKGVRKVTLIGPILGNNTFSFIYGVEDIIKDEISPSSLQIECLYFVSPWLYMGITCAANKGMKKIPAVIICGIMMRHIFEIKLVSKVPLSAFTAMQSSVQQNQKRVKETRSDVDMSQVYLLHLVPRSQAMKEIDDLKKLNNFLKYFINMQTKQTERFIPKMCSVFPECGIHLIRLGVSMMDTVQDITPQQYIQIYKEMKSWPGYELSALHELLIGRGRHDESALTKSLVPISEDHQELVVYNTEMTKNSLMNYKNEQEILPYDEHNEKSEVDSDIHDTIPDIDIRSEDFEKNI